MPLLVEQLLSNPDFHETVRDQSRALLRVNDQSPRLAAVFGTQQRWLLGHLAMAQYFQEVARGNPDPVVLMARYLEQVKTLGLSSVNTADAFIKEMLVYGIGQQSQTADRRNRPFVPTPIAIAATRHWTFIHLTSLDRLDGGHRLDAFEANEAIMARLHPEITRRALVSPEFRTPSQTWSLFTWLNNGGIVMDWLMVGVEPVAPSVERIPTQVRSVPELAENFRLSRTHLTRKLREAEALGSIGWEGNRGRSTMWISREFLSEYLTTQAVKLAFIDAACEVVGLR
ncbi:hypothetical protein [Rhizobium sp. 'Codium 1']|uniref:hypothetical protein n=1 Tax=Rhizobium sp. 'Codium 1' TaxID=2940484 RepID=UPI001E5F2F64|nr:hypothetical protein [Rhizobium sp. 'Codium 1']MCC8932097.1 hypothetical protein [Rhizobium sp. 'Codium 1']